MLRFLVCLLMISFVLWGCSGDKSDQDISKDTGNDSAIATEAVEMPDLSGFNINDYLDTVSAESDRIAGRFLKLSVLDGNYKEALELSCQSNRKIAENDSLAQYVIYGKNNPDWTEQQSFQYDLTRAYIPVIAKFNKIYYVRKLHCADSCLYEYKVGGPRYFNRLYKIALGDDGFSKFSSYLHNAEVPLKERKAYYEQAYEKIASISDHSDVVRIAEYDTLVLVRENNHWKVCKQAEDVREMFQQNK